MACEHVKWQPKWTIEKYDKDGNLYDVLEIDGNCLLNEGITEMWNLITGKSATAWSTNSYIGVGDSTTAAVATQSGLLGANKKYIQVDDTYPVVAGQTVTYEATFGPDDANFDWREITVANGSSDTAKNMNRKVQDMGRKAQGATWVARLQISLS